MEEKWLVALVGIATIIAGIYQYRKTSARAAMSPFLERQLKSYHEIMTIVGTLSSTNDEDIFASNLTEFWIFYYGPLALVENPEVANEMYSLGKILEEPNFRNPQFKSNVSKGSLILAAACRRSISKSWEIDLEDLKKSLVKH